jgi:hypothetical protein
MVRYAITPDTTYNSLDFDPENPGVWAERVQRAQGHARRQY